MKNLIRLWRFNKRGWKAFGRLLSTNNPEFWIKRANWYYNFGNSRIMFCGVFPPPKKSRK